MRTSELVIQLLLASALGLPTLILLGYVGLRQFKLFLTVVSEISSSQSGLPAPLKHCKGFIIIKCWRLHKAGRKTMAQLCTDFHKFADVAKVNSNLEQSFGYALDP